MMCLGVYLGTSAPLSIPTDVRPGSLAVEHVDWTPPPLARHSHVYYLGQKTEGPELGCSCLLLEHVEWTDSGPAVFSDATYPDEGPCPFDQLREMCASAAQNGGWTTLVSDDQGGARHDNGDECYSSGAVRLDQIARGNLLFDDVDGTPWRVLHVIDVGDRPIRKQDAALIPPPRA